MIIITVTDSLNDTTITLAASTSVALTWMFMQTLINWYGEQVTVFAFDKIGMVGGTPKEIEKNFRNSLLSVTASKG